MVDISNKKNLEKCIEGQKYFFKINYNEKNKKNVNVN